MNKVVARNFSARDKYPGNATTETTRSAASDECTRCRQPNQYDRAFWLKSGYSTFGEFCPRCWSAAQADFAPGTRSSADVTRTTTVMVLKPKKFR